jgi:hypothetical protein
MTSISVTTGVSLDLAVMAFSRCAIYRVGWFGSFVSNRLQFEALDLSDDEEIGADCSDRVQRDKDKRA